MTRSNAVRVVSWNIRFGIEIDTAISELRSIAELRAPDILLLQEMDEAGTAAIAESLDANYVYNSAAPHRQTGRDFGNAIISPWPMTGGAEVPLPHQARVGGQPRSATRARVKVGVEDVLAYSAHAETPVLPLPKRVEQFAAIATDVGERMPATVIVGGDFNTATNRDVSALVEVMSAVGLELASNRAGPTMRRAGRDMVLDHVFASGLVTERSGVASSATASDHMPVWIELHGDLD